MEEGHEEDTTKTTPPLTLKLVPLMLRMHSPEHPSSGTATPPLQTPASVPFKWEEQPGKPRPCSEIIIHPNNIINPSKIMELEPPPCRQLLFPVSSHETPSPTTVLDGPYNVGRPKFSSFRLFRDQGQQDLFDAAGGSSSSSSGASPLGGGGGHHDEKFKLSRRFLGKVVTLKRGKKEKKGGSFRFTAASSSSTTTTPCSSSSSSSCCEWEGGFEESWSIGGKGRGGGGKVRRNGSFCDVPQARTTHLWATIYGGLKQVMPWKSNKKSKKQAPA